MNINIEIKDERIILEQTNIKDDRGIILLGVSELKKGYFHISELVERRNNQEKIVNEERLSSRQNKDIHLLSKEIYLSMLQETPTNITRDELFDMKSFIANIIEKQQDMCKMYPYNLIEAEDGFTLTLVIYNKGIIDVELPQVPVKVIDYNNRVVFKKMCNINRTINVNKVLIRNIYISRSEIVDSNYDLTNFNIVFGL